MARDESTEQANRKYREDQRANAAEKLERARGLLVDAGTNADKAGDEVLQGHITTTLASLEDGLDLILEAAGR